MRVPSGGVRPTPAELDTVDASEVRCFDDATSEAMVAAIKAAAKEGDSLGGVVEVLGLRGAGRARQPTSTGTANSTACWHRR